jgi:hypothetical protein
MTMTMDTDRQFQEADAAIKRTVADLVSRVEQLSSRWDAVAPSYIVQRALLELCTEMTKLIDDPLVADFAGPLTLKLSNAMADYRDLPQQR